MAVIRVPLAAALSVLLVAGCERRAAEQEAASSIPEPAADRMAPQAAKAPPPMTPGAAAEPAPAAPPPLAPRKLIRTGQIALEVGDVPRAARDVERIATGLGGYVAETQVSGRAGENRSASVTLRVPAERFGEAMAALEALGKLQGQSARVDDVSRAYADLETRLRVKREAETRLRAILSGRAARLSDVIEAERELMRVVEEIERMEGERRSFDQQVALSTITVALAEPAAVLRGSALQPLRDAFRGAGEALATSLAVLLMLVIVAGPWVLAAWIAWRVFRAWRRRRARRVTSGDTPDAPA